jgi:hypothetical protein
MTPRIFINPQVDILYFSEKRGGEYNEVFIQVESTYFDYFKTMTMNTNSSVLTELRRIALIDEAYLANLEWDIKREDVFSLIKFTNLEIAAIVLDAGNKIDGPVKLVQVTWGQCPIRKFPISRRITPSFASVLGSVVML